MPYRMLRYLVRVWDRHLQEGEGNKEYKKYREYKECKESVGTKRLPAIIPLVVHHGERAWTAPKRFSELIDLEPELLSEIAEQVPDFELVLDDLTAVEDHEILQRPMTPYGQLVLLGLKRARHSADLGSYLRLWAETIRQVLEAQGGVDALAVISYCILRHC